MNANAIAPLTELDQKKVKSVLNDCPPWLWNIEQNPTDDQIRYWHELKDLYQDLRKVLENYFQGLALPSLEHRSADARELLSLQFQWYLSFYTLAYWGWSYVEQNASKRGIDLGERCNVRSPSEALAYVIYLDSRACLEPSLQAYYRHSPSETRDLARADRRITQAEAYGEPPKKQALKKYQQSIDRLRSPVEQYLNFRDSIVAICEGQIKMKGAREVKSALKAYKRAKSDLDAKVQSMSHERHKRIGGEWRNGRYSPMDSAGGRPSKPPNKTSQ